MSELCLIRYWGNNAWHLMASAWLHIWPFFYIMHIPHQALWFLPLYLCTVYTSAVCQAPPHPLKQAEACAHLWGLWSSSSGVSQLLLMLFCFVLNTSQPQFPFISLISVNALADPSTTKMQILLILKPPAPWDSVCIGIHVIGSCISTNKTQS